MKLNYIFFSAFCFFVISVFNLSRAENIDKIEF